jgi:hypothetical protein
MKSALILFIALLITARDLAAGGVSFESPEQQVGLLELYTSEGCSSCPPADRWLTALKDDPRLWQGFIPIALHVDYWDYIGWKDRFASPAHSRRQRQYSKEQSLKAVYTPGFVYNGSEWRQWYRNRSANFPAGNTPGVLQIHIEDESVQVQFTPGDDAGFALTKPVDLQLNLALLGFGLETEVRAGENKGKKLPHDFVVLGMKQSVLSPVNGNYAARLSLPEASATPNSYGIVAWLNAHGTQRPLQAVGGFLPLGSNR